MERKGFIGGSDCVRIMRGEWRTLWAIKTGREEPEDLSDNIAVQLGTHTESFNLNWFEKQFRMPVDYRQKTFSDLIGTVPAQGTIDGMVDTQIIEAKHTNSYTNMDEIIERYMPQVQLYCYLAKADGAHLSVIFGNNKWESAFVRYDKDYFDSMWAVVSDFWGCVIRDEEPVGIDVPEIKIDKIAVDDMVRKDAATDNAFIDAAHTYINNQAAAKVFEGAKSDLKNMVASNEREVYCDLLTIKRAKNGSLRITTK